jgi:hypothetical protein
MYFLSVFCLTPTLVESEFLSPDNLIDNILQHEMHIFLLGDGNEFPSPNHLNVSFCMRGDGHQPGGCFRERI